MSAQNIFRKWIGKITVWGGRLALLLSFLLIAFCLAFDFTFLSRVFGLELVLQLRQRIALVVGFQLLAIVPSLWIILRRRQGTLARAAFRIAAVGLIGSILFGAYGTLRVLGVINPNRQYLQVADVVPESGY